MQRPPQKAQASAVPVKRVLRQGIYSICGVCRRAYGSLAQAEACLARCLHAFVNAAPVVAEGGEGKRFRCHFCKRVYGSREDAQTCAAACKLTTQQKIEAQQAVAAPASATAGGQAPAGARDGPAQMRAGSAVGQAASSSGGGKAAHGSQASSAPGARGSSAAAARKPSMSPKDEAAKARRRSQQPNRKDQMHKFLRDGRKLICRKCGAEHPTLDKVIACYDAHPENASASAPKAPEDKFFRDGAKYVCRGCQKKFFTQTDVIACFDGHAGEPAVAGPEPVIADVSTPAEPVAAAPVVPVGNDDDKFYRDGAKYVCRKCSAKYFTRGDVVACHDKH